MKPVRNILSSELFDNMASFDAVHAYTKIMRELHGPKFDMSPLHLRQLLNNPTELLVFVVRGNEILGTAQASLARTPPVQQVYINNVVLLPKYRGKGYGRSAMERLQSVSIARWSETSWPIRFVLTNSPEKANAGFYDRIGYRPRTEATNYATVVWVKDM